ncbi:MAG TPA: class I SAM-dependent methyltransferase [Candidatus Tectomicrobia bacterium]|nr:class I SAM-dependent methyltransferase [Candidatus Tectomicrobia bacterium]
MILQGLVTQLVQKVSGLIDTFSLEPQQLTSHDRSILTEVILPYFAQHTVFQKILFVGCSAYTQRYEELFKGKEYWTIDPKQVKRKYGSKRHIVDSVTNIGRYVARRYFDVIIMNGVIGFGLNHIGDIEPAIDACYEALASEGILLVGWNDTPRRTPIDIRQLRALSKFREHAFEPLKACHYQAQGSHRHTFSFYRRP